MHRILSNKQIEGYTGVLESRLLPITALLIFTVISIVLAFSFSPIGDEKSFHHPTFLNFYHTGFWEAITGNNYNSANTPLPYLLAKLLFICNPPDISMLRLLTLIFSFGALAFCWLILGKLTNQNTRSVIFITILFFPYLFKSSCSYYMGNYGLFFALMAIFFYLEKGFSPQRIFLTGLSTALAILCQQFYIAFAMAFPLSIMIKNKNEPVLSIIRKFAFFSLPLILPLFLFFVWGGLVHPHTRYYGIETELPFHKIAFSFTHITSVLTITGFYLLPVFIVQLRKIPWLEMFSYIILCLILTFFFSPQHSSVTGPDIITGVVYRLMSLAGRILPSSDFVLRILLSFSGLVVFRSIFLTKTEGHGLILKLIIASLTLVFLFDNLLVERHLLPLVVLLLISSVHFSLPRITQLVWASAMFLLGTSYTIYWFYQQSGLLFVNL